MKKKFSFFLSLLVLIMFSFSISKSNEIQREPSGVFDVQTNTISNVEIYISNYGINLFNGTKGTGSCIWPRGTHNNYIFAGGTWFGAKKRMPDGDLRKLCALTYNPNNGRSWMVPGRLSDGDEVDKEDAKKYRIYFSTDMNVTGTPKVITDGPNWPIWEDKDKSYLELGFWVDVDERNPESSQKWAKFFSDEDMFCTYKDSDLIQYDGGSVNAIERGYPLGLQWEQTVFSWDDEEKQDIIIIFQKIINTSTDTLFNCWIAPLFDFDIGDDRNLPLVSGNDRTRYISEDESLNMGIAWTDGDQGEAGQGFGYMSASIIMSPFTDKSNYMHNEFLMEPDRQLGLVTFKNWSIEEDVHNDSLRYEFISSGEKDGDKGDGDRRMLLATGTFNMLPGDTAYFAVQLNFALPSSGDEATGTTEDIVNLIEKVKLGKEYVYKNIVTSIFSPASSNIKTSIFPNPFSESTTIIYELQAAVQVTIKVYDALGIEVAELVNEFQDSGVQSCTFSGENLTSGVYYYSIQIGNGVQSGKVLLVK